jgi:hypothetical protein
MTTHPTTVAAAVRLHQPARQVIATFDNYADAERAVDYLADQRFEVDRVAIVGRDLELVEQVTGRMNYGWAALRGAISGGLVGATSAPSRHCTRDNTTSSPTWPWPTRPCSCSAAPAIEGNRRWQQR